ncbi:MAG: flagellar biosynthesis/type III secretory pathway M-ring protein FliF/YscJ [Planctomycetota bacterium]|jgi:flagellar biosynthesis/type III secretory pathway M-ring protein FliF/YscJ
MNAVFTNLLTQLKNAGPSARWAMGAVLGFVMLIASVLAYQARNPHFVVLAADMDTPAFNTAITALAGADIRYETTMGPPPHMIRVEESKKHQALDAIYQSGEFLGSSRGISSGLGGSSSVFLGQSERHQRTQKRLWEEAEMQLERLNYVAKATLAVSGAETSPLARSRADERRASVVLTLRGATTPSAGETRALVGIVRGATGVSEDRITIVDQHSNVVFDGADADGATSLLALEEKFSRDRSNQAQRLLDRTFPAGLTVVGVRGTWKQVQEESISNTLDPSKKPRSERSRKTEDPEWPQSIGGPAGVGSNTAEGSGSESGVTVPNAMSTTSEKETNYTFGSTTTHRIAQPHQLERLSISLVLDASLEEHKADAEALVKALVGFEETRGDVIVTRSTSLPSVMRDAEGIPILPDPIEPPAPASPMLKLALEHGLEILAGLAFLMVLMKSLKSARATTASTGPGGTTVGGRRANEAGGKSSGGNGDFDEMDETVDIDALARAHIEDLLQTEPEKVSSLLSRWALAEDAFAEAVSK